MLFKGVVLNVLAERENLKKIGLNLKFDVFEMQSEANVGTGNAFQVDFDAAMNTGIPGRVPSVIWDKIPSEYQYIVPAAGDLASFAAEALASTADMHREELRNRNLVAYDLFVKSLHGGKTVDVSTPCTTRGKVGDIQHDSIQKVLKFVEDNVPEIKIEFHYSHTVVDADFSTPTKPKLIVRKDGGGGDGIHEYEFDFVHFAHGTTWKDPVSNPGVVQNAFSGTPNSASVRRFLSDKGLLSGDKIRSDAQPSLCITVMSLSAYDFIPIILRYTNMICFSHSKNCYEIDSVAAEQYQGLFTFISRTRGKTAPPRHHFSHQWPGRKLSHNGTFVDTNQVHAMFLKKDFDWLSFSRPLLYHGVAYERHTTPRKINILDCKMTTAARTAAYHAQTALHRIGEVTEIGLIRAGYHAIFEGFGFENNPDDAHAKFVDRAPLSRKGREGWLVRRSALFDVTHPDFVKDQSNREFFRNVEELILSFSASPVAVQDLISQLFSLGVATHVVGECSDIEYDNEHQKIALNITLDGGGIKRRHFDAMFASKTITSHADILLQAIKSKAMEATELKGAEAKVKLFSEGVLEYAKGRFLQTVDRTLIHATDAGLGGHGDDAKGYRVGMQWTDTHDLASSANWAATASRTLVLLSAMKADGMKAGYDSSPVQDLMKIYEDSLPTDKAFEEEAASFEQDWLELVKKKGFLDTCEHFAKDADDYCDLAGNAFDHDSRQKCLSRLAERHHSHCILEGVYAYDLKRRNEAGVYNPVNKKQFFRRFVDFTSGELERCWNNWWDSKFLETAADVTA
ncbi:hypothetical protein CONPUDRAFT_155259 [Coniophora puteana RWD-64-598 SS2]|uniref:Uncharacterized protein n=1 Tax=Coniophora puteana (strain RWD-64-598) TaxID=741705 RepID=A0A5M3ML92_CONPW|nr:uncharacterized protein CONPUDRAFT_155259 [Coniophora puteana RWD-64-598 SS2]EIW79863.1 hypothetical protein CONPUDRAFT_155259 [Coniophora puteana RWD-64-598 SS2]